MLYLHVCLSRSRLCHALCPPWAYACQSLRSFACVIASVPLVDYVDVTTCEVHLHGVGLLDAYPFFAPCVVMLALLALCHPFGFHCFFASLHACLHVHSWVYVLSILQFHGTMDTQSKLTFFLLGHPLLFDNRFVCPCLALLLIACLLACFPSTCFFTCLQACFLCHCMYTLGEWTLGVRVWPPRCKKNGQGCKQVDVSPQRAMFSRLGGLASLSGYIFLPLS